MPLGESDVKALQSRATKYRVSAGGGLLVEVHPAGYKYFLWRFRFPPAASGKQQDLQIGPYGKGVGKFSLRQAREERDRLEQLRRSGINPKSQKEDVKAAVGRGGVSFEDAVEEFIKVAFVDAGRTEVYIKNERNKFNSEILPVFRGRSVASIHRSEVFAIKDEISARGSHAQAQRVMGLLNRFFDFTINRGYVKENPAKAIGREFSPHVAKHHPFLKQWQDVPPLLKALNKNEANGAPQTILAIKMLLLTGLRVEAVIPARWEEFDLKQRLWLVPKERMKIGRFLHEDHKVPIADPLLEILNELQTINGQKEHLFWSPRGTKDPHISKSTPNNHLKKMGYDKKQTAHGFRHVITTHGSEQLDVEYALISMQIGHIEKDPIKRAYDHAQWWPKRVEFMCRWGDLLVASGL